MTYIPTLDEMAAAIAPLMNLSAKIKQPATFPWAVSVTVRQHLLLMAVDAPEPFPKRITPLYKRREREFGEKLEQALGPNWIVTSGQDKESYSATQSALKEGHAIGMAHYIPERTSLLYSKHGEEIIPGTDKLSGSAVRFAYVAAKFETEEIKVAWQICR